MKGSALAGGMEVCRATGVGSVLPGLSGTPSSFCLMKNEASRHAARVGTSGLLSPRRGPGPASLLAAGSSRWSAPLGTETREGGDQVLQGPLGHGGEPVGWPPWEFPVSLSPCLGSVAHSTPGRSARTGSCSPRGVRAAGKKGWGPSRLPRNRWLQCPFGSAGPETSTQSCTSTGWRSHTPLASLAVD